MRVDLSDVAEADLAAIHDYLVERSGTAADRVMGSIAQALRGLGRFPLLGKPGHYPGTREHITARYGYRIIYMVDERAQVVDVLRILHGAQQWPAAE